MSRKHYESEKPIDPETQARRAAAMRKFWDRRKRARDGGPQDTPQDKLQDMNAFSRRIWAKRNAPLVAR